MAVGIVLGIYALALWALLISCAWRWGFKEWKANRSQRLERAQAKLLDKREESGKCYLYFEFAGRQKEFEVDAETYAANRIGQQGTLHLKGGAFASFEQSSASDVADGVYQRMVGS